MNANNDVFSFKRAEAVKKLVPGVMMMSYNFYYLRGTEEGRRSFNRSVGAPK